MAFSIDDFDKIWASTSPLTPYTFSDANYKQGWNFVGATPPSRQMWDSIQKQNDEKAQWLYLNVVQGIPIGVVQAFAGSTTPQGWLLCDGSAISRTDYANLFAVIGTSYGAGDGSTTFNLPNLVDKFIEGSATAGTEKSAGLPNITGSFTIRGLDTNGTARQIVDGASTAFSLSSAISGMVSAGVNGENDGSRTVNFSATNSNAIYGNSATVQPPAVTMRYIIKY